MYIKLFQIPAFITELQELQHTTFICVFLHPIK